MRIVGREREKAELRRLLASSESEFLVVYGRRRVGKTFLVREYFGPGIVFHVTGLLDDALATQLANFDDALDGCGERLATPSTSWMTAFNRLRDHLKRSPVPATGKRVVFLDEMPWMATPRSGFLTALEHFWNGWAVAQPDILLVVCGSATSWVVKKLLRDRGGLHNRVTSRLLLEPFTLRECEEYVEALGLALRRKQILEAYMVFGGVPYYLRLLRPDRSLAQNIDALCFAPAAPLLTEFEQLMHSLFTHAERHIAVIEAIGARLKGLTQAEIVAASGVASGGTLTQILHDLESCGFLRAYHEFTTPRHDITYQLIDPFSLFHLRYLKDRTSADTTGWLTGVDDPARRVWSGYAFELACLLHVDQIKAALGIAGVATSVAAWRSSGDPGAQIDLVIDRRDMTINLCEMKYAGGVLVLDKRLADALERKRAVFLGETGTDKDVHLTLVTTFGVTRSKHAGVITSEVTMDDLFR